jgi:hypothetical protein
MQERKEEQKSTGVGTLDNPFTYNSNATNPTKYEIIREAATSETEKAAKGTPIYFKFETGTFYIQRCSSSELLFQATLVATPKIDSSSIDNTKWTSQACSLFTLEAMKLEIRKLIGD